MIVFCINKKALTTLLHFQLRLHKFLHLPVFVMKGQFLECSDRSWWCCNKWKVSKLGHFNNLQTSLPVPPTCQFEQNASPELLNCLFSHKIMIGSQSWHFLCRYLDSACLIRCANSRWDFVAFYDVPLHDVAVKRVTWRDVLLSHSRQMLIKFI